SSFFYMLRPPPTSPLFPYTTLFRSFGATGHDAGPVECAFLATGDAGAHEVQTTFPQRGLTASGVGEVRVARVDDDVAGFQQRCELVDHGVGGGARLHHDDDLAWSFERGHELLRGVGRYELAFGTELLDQVLGPLSGPVVQGHGVSVTGQVTCQVASHHGEAGDADACLCRLRAHSRNLT